jgi:hypothetical protein
MLVPEDPRDEDPYPIPAVRAIGREPPKNGLSRKHRMDPKGLLRCFETSASVLSCPTEDVEIE